MYCIILQLGIDGFVGACIAPLAIAILISGLDDIVVDLVWLWAWVRGRRAKAAVPESRPQNAPEKRIAIFVPLWREDDVIERMLDHNLAAIRYRNYDFFVGGYPNDDRTLEAVRHVEARSPHVHLAVCPHPGPTSKADCLNWIYQRMLLHEERYRVRFDVVVTHDAEDMIHPESLRVMNREVDSFDMVQIPVLPLRTPALEMVHGIYCDEFAEYQLKDMLVRRIMGSFTPSSGVGTAYSRGGWRDSRHPPIIACSSHSALLKITRTGCGCTCSDALKSSCHCRPAPIEPSRRASIFRARCGPRSGSGRAG